MTFIRSLLAVLTIASLSFTAQAQPTKEQCQAAAEMTSKCGIELAKSADEKKPAAKPAPKQSSGNSAVLAQLRLDLQQAREALASREAEKKASELVTATGDKLVDCGTMSRIVFVGNDGRMFATCKGAADEIFRAPAPATAPAPQVIVVQPANVHQLGGQAPATTPTTPPSPVPSGVYGCNIAINGNVVADFMDKTKNPYGEQVAPQGEGPKCRALLERFKRENPQYRY
jgi:hypothetical protein